MIRDLVCYWYFCWAARDINPMHADLLEVMERRRYYADRLGYKDTPGCSIVPAWFPRHWSARCARLRLRVRSLSR